MPLLPSGRRIGLSTDRFKAHLGQLSLDAATRIYHSLKDADDLLHIADVVYFSADSDSPYFANFVVADWEANTQGWTEADIAAFRTWLDLPGSRQAHQEAVDELKDVMKNMEFPT